jgi:small subunit ribosomal protein S9
MEVTSKVQGIRATTKDGIVHTIGRRKTSVARVYLQSGDGKITVNKKDYKTYFPTPQLQNVLNQAQQIINAAGQYDVNVIVEGGGITGQAEAIRLGISRALVILNPENKPALRSKGFVTRDSRMVERKKPGQKKARKRFQFSKR